MGSGNWDILSALQSALFISTMEDITCILPHPSCTSISPLLFHLARVRRFISRFPSVKKVTLQLDSLDYWKGNCLSVGNDEALRAWTSTLGDLLNCILDRECNSLTIAHGGYFTRGYELSREGSLQLQSLTRRVVASIGRFLFSKIPPDHWEFRRVPQQGREWIVVPAPMGSAHLTSLHIQSTILLVPPGLNWTLSVLRNCPITTLTISEVISLDPEVWSTVLPLINSAAPNITTLLMLGVTHITKKDLGTFCTRFPRITHLELSARFAYSTADAFSVRIPRLRHLLSLKAPPEFLDRCLQFNGRFPKLQSVSILCHPYQSLEWLAGAEGIARNLAALMLRFERRLLSPALSLSLERSFISIANDLHFHPYLSDELRQHLDRVVGVELWTMFPVHFEETGKIGRWISVFRQVERVAITVEYPTDDEAASIALIVQAMSPTKFMQTVEVNGRIYDLAGGVP